MSNSYDRRVAIIISDEWRGDANKVAELMGWGEDAYRIPLSASGQAPATHWGLSTATQNSFVEMIGAVRAGHEVGGLDPDLVAPVVAEIMFDVRGAGADAGLQFNELASGAGLQIVGDGSDEPLI